MLTIGEKQSNDARRQQDLREMMRRTHENMVSDKAHQEKFVQASTPPSHTDQSWDEMVFENRNREYGAYAVRKGYNRNLVVAVVATLIVFILILLYPAITKWLGANEVPVKDPPRKLVYTELSAPPPIDKPKPPPPQVQLPRLQKIIKFVPPKVVREEVREVIPTIEEIKVNETAAEAVEGPTEVIFEEPVAEVVGGQGDDELFTVVDQQPEYAGGYDAMMSFIKSNMTYPPNARRMRVEGTVHVSFIVSKTGAISDVKVLRGIMTECDREAVRVVQMMPPWKPGKQNGRPVNVRFIMPLKFRLN